MKFKKIFFKSHTFTKWQFYCHGLLIFCLKNIHLKKKAKINYPELKSLSPKFRVKPNFISKPENEKCPISIL